MILYTDTYLIDNHSTKKVNGGNKIKLVCTGISMTYKSFTTVKDNPGKESNSMTNNDYLSSGDWIGSSNATITVNGIIEIVKADLVTEVSVLTVTLKILQQIMKSGHIFKFYDQWDRLKPRWRMHGLGINSVFPDESPTYMTVRPFSLSVNTRPDKGTEGRVMDYTLVLKEVKNE